MTAFEVQHDKEGFEKQSGRYRRIDALNRESFLMKEESSLQVIQSLHSVGARRDALTPEYAKDLDEDIVAKAVAVGRQELVGNVSPLNGYGPKSLEPEARIDDAKSNILEFLAANDVEPSSVHMLRPERDYTTPLSVVNLDNEPHQPDDTGLARPDTAGDFIYSFDSEAVLAARPADCPIVFVSAETPKGEVAVLLHLAWQGVANNYVNQAKGALDELEVNWDTVRAQITPGGHAESFGFTNYKQGNPNDKYPGYEGMFGTPRERELEDGSKVHDFEIDLAAEVYEEIVDRWGIDTYQVFLDTSDTTSPTVGYSSHSRSFKEYDESGENSRDLVLAKRKGATHSA